jgi:DNA-binding transcriptional ArsR family regulator
MMTQIRNRPPATAARRRVSRPATPRLAAARREPIDRLVNPTLFKALCDPTRASLIACIAKCGRGCSVGEVAECCAVDLSVVSRHLALLARAGVLESTRTGRTVLYRVRYAALGQSLRELADALDECCPACEGGRCGC